MLKPANLFIWNAHSEITSHAGQFKGYHVTLFSSITRQREINEKIEFLSGRDAEFPALPVRDAHKAIFSNRLRTIWELEKTLSLGLFSGISDAQTDG